MDPNSGTAVTMTLVRHALQVGAGVLIARGVVDEGTATEAVGGLISIGTMLWGVYSGRKQRAATAAAVAAVKPST